MNNILTNTIIVIVLTLIIIIPIIIINARTSKNRKEKGFQKFAELCKLNKLEISNPDYFGQKLAGVDPVRKVFLFLDNSSVDVQAQVIDLSKIAECRVLNRSNNTEVSELGLEFDGPGGSRQSVLFYKQYKDKESLLRIYTQKAEEWRSKIKAL